ncbi:squalene epoxidase 5-like isoform X3 [Brassica rapa]|uniref:squalene epoxidase 5-like isoform X3 n=1 Tax=Brassica campestris TaxID=3711 RepID=UPI00142DFAA2|nr:squalene epoxidase 5-like isoform X3 [Brassica rapa]
MDLPHVWLWTMLLAFVLTWMIFHFNNQRKKKSMLKLAEAATEEIREGVADIIIVGAGVGGSALAYALAKDGRRVHVIERDMREPERIMGEVMQPGGRFMLAKLGLQDCLEGIDAQKLTGLAVYKDGKEGVLPFPVENNTFPYEPSARSFHNGRLVQRLRQRASSLPNDEVRCIAEIPADSVPSMANGEMSTFLKESMAPQIPIQLREIFIKGINDGASMKVVPTKSMSATLSEKKGVIVLGDAFNMRHPLIASGMMVVLSDVLILRHLLKPLENLANVTQVSQVIKNFNDIRKPMSATVNTLGDAFSQVLVASKDEAKEAMRQGCYDYLCSGGFRTSGLMALLGGMNPRPLSLILHIFGITFTSIGHLLSPFPTPLRIWHSLRLFVSTIKMLGHHMKVEGARQMLYPESTPMYHRRYMAATALQLNDDVSY